MPQMGVGVPDEVMVALSKRRISLLLDHQAGQLVQPDQTATAVMMSTVLSGHRCRVSSCWHQSPYAMTLVSWTHVEARGLGLLADSPEPARKIYCWLRVS